MWRIFLVFVLALQAHLVSSKKKKKKKKKAAKTFEIERQIHFKWQTPIMTVFAQDIAETFEDYEWSFADIRNYFQCNSHPIIGNRKKILNFSYW